MNGLRRNDAGEPGNAGTTKLPLVSVVILNWNGIAFLQKFLPHVLASTYVNKRVIVADNASADDSMLFLKQHFPTVEILENSVNEGFAKGYNTALKQIKSDYYVLLNSDVEVTPGWIEPVVELMEKDLSIAACQPKILDYNRKNCFEYAGASGGWIDSFGYPFSRGRVFEEIEEDKGQYDDAVECFWASGAAMFTRADMYHKAGGLDEYFFAHQEEIDLCWRLQLAGYKICVQPASVVYHVGGGTLSKDNQYKTFLNFRNNLIMCAKNWPISTALYKVPIRIMLDAIAAWKGLLQGNAGFFVAIVKAHLHFIKWLLAGRQQSVFATGRSIVLSGCYRSLIVWDFFIKKRKRFSEIVTGKK